MQSVNPTMAHKHRFGADLVVVVVCGRVVVVVVVVKNLRVVVAQVGPGIPRPAAISISMSGIAIGPPDLIKEDREQLIYTLT